MVTSPEIRQLRGPVSLQPKTMVSKHVASPRVRFAAGREDTATGVAIPEATTWQVENGRRLWSMAFHSQSQATRRAAPAHHAAVFQGKVKLLASGRDSLENGR